MVIPRPDPAGDCAEDVLDEIEAIRAGDTATFESFMRRYAPELCIFARRYVGSPDAAEELVQEVFCRLWERRRHWPADDGVRAYLYKMTRNLALDDLRHERVERAMEAQSLGDNAGVPGMGNEPISAMEQLERDELTSALERAIEELPERCRMVFTLRWKHHLSYAEIAKTMGISVKGVEIQRTRGMKVLQRLLASFIEDRSKP